MDTVFLDLFLFCILQNDLNLYGNVMSGRIEFTRILHVFVCVFRKFLQDIEGMNESMNYSHIHFQLYNHQMGLQQEILHTVQSTNFEEEKKRSN